MKSRRKPRLSFRSRGVRLLVSACVVGAFLLAARVAPVAAPGDLPAAAAGGAPRCGQEFLYVANGGGTGVSVYAIRADGSLVPLAGPFAADEGPSGLAVGSADSFIYVANAGARSRRHHYGDVTAFSIGPGGLLRELPSSPYFVGGILQSLALSPDGRYLYTINSRGIWPFAVRPNGSIELSSRKPVSSGGGAPQGLALSPSGTHLYTVEIARPPTGSVSSFTIGSQGMITSAGGTSVSAGGVPTGAIAVTPDGRYLYVANRRSTTAYSVRSNGSLRRIAGFAAAADLSAMIVGRSGHFLYACDAQAGTVRVYRIDARGRLAALEAPVSTGARSSPDALALTPDGRVLFVADTGSNAVSAFRIGPTGALRRVAGSPYPAPRGPDALAVVRVDLPRAAGAVDPPGAAAHPSSSTKSPPVASCRKDPLAGVYHPWRLHINNPCVTVTGTVVRVRTEPDHDWHVNLRLPPASQHLVNAANRRWEHGDLVVEVIPMDQPYIVRPEVGEQITVTGAYVLDADHGWEEIHPAWLLDGTGRVHHSAQEASRSVETGIRGNESYFGKRN